MMPLQQLSFQNNITLYCVLYIRGHVIQYIVTPVLHHSGVEALACHNISVPTLSLLRLNA